MNKIQIARATAEVTTVQNQLSTVMTLMPTNPEAASLALRSLAARLKSAATQVDLAQVRA